MDIEESKKRGLVRVAETMSYLPDLSFKTGNFWKVYNLAKQFPVLRDLFFLQELANDLTE